MNTDPAETDASWPSAWSAVLSDVALLAASSQTIFARGEAYARSGAVRVVDEDPMPEPALRAQVIGTATYSVEVWIEADAVAGDCDCPHAADGWFCKHQVAAAIVWRQRSAGQAPVAPFSSPPGKVGAPRTAAAPWRALHAFLHRQDAASLADKLLDLAARDRGVERELQQWRKLSTLDGDWAGIRRAVSNMLSPSRDFIDWDEGEDYVARAGAVLPVLRKAIARDPAPAVSLALHALRGAWAVLEQADDSDGVIGDFCAAIGAEFVAALQAAPDQSSAFGDVYLALRIDEPFRAFDALAAEAAMGEAALAHYRRTLRSRWRAARDARLAPRPGDAPGTAPRATRQMPGPSAADLAGSAAQGRAFEAIERLHLEQLVRTGELDEALAVLRSDLSTPWAHRRVVRFLEEQGRYREAFAAAEAAVKQHPADRFLEDDLLRCYERDGWTEEAFALRQQQFEREPTVERYQAVVAAGLAAARPGEAVRATLFEALVAQEQRAMGEEAARMVRPPFSRVAVVRRDENSEPARIGPDVSLRARILCSESRWLDAWAVVQPPSVCTDAVLQHIARHLPATHHPEAVRLLKQVFERVMPRSTSPYREALALVADIAARMPADQRAAWLMGLRVGFKAKRNFVRDLPCG